MFDQLASSLPYFKSGRLRAVAVTSPARLAVLPDLATVGELGYPGIQMSSWASVTAPAGTPADVIGVLSKAILEVLQEPKVRQRMESTGAVVEPAGPAELAKLQIGRAHV